MKKFNIKAPSKKVLIIAAAVMLLIAVAATTAFLLVKLDPKKNTFTPAEIKTEVKEEFEDNEDLPGGKEKKNVKVENTGDADVYVRATVVINWKDDSGNVYYKAPVSGTDYSLTIGTEKSWKKSGSYWYYIEKVAPKATTAVLIDDCKQLKDAPEGYHLSVEILTDAIQATPEKAVKEAWGVKLSSSKIVFD